MRLTRIVASIVVLAVAAAAAGTATAETFPLQTKPTREQVGAACDKVGGVGYGTKGSSGGYGCINNANGTGVDCDAKGNCTGTVPGKVTPPPRSALRGEMAVEGVLLAQ